MKIRKIIILTLILAIAFLLNGCQNKIDNNKITMVASNYVGYDFLRAVTKGNDNIDLKLLINPGQEVHDFEPTPLDIVNISKSKLFLYTGGDSDEWIEDIVNAINYENTTVLQMMDMVDLIEEDDDDFFEHDDDHDHDDIEYDEHVWTNPKNAIKIIENITDNIINIDPDNKTLYEKNKESYISKISKIDEEITNVVSAAKRKEIVFGDKFPLIYFAKEYNLTYYAAFPGCSDDTEVNARTMSYLINKVKEKNIPVVFHIELSNKKIAKAIAKETNTKVLEFNAMHNISKKDFNSKVTYVDIMNQNIKVLKEALN